MKAPSISLIAATSLLLSMFSISAAASEVGAADTLSSHSAVDIADVYLFRDPPNSTPGPGSRLVVALTTQPLASSSFGPTYHFQENALYRLNFTTPSLKSASFPSARAFAATNDWNRAVHLSLGATRTSG